MKSARILFVDDEQGIRLTLPEALRQRGFSVTAVGTVNEALAEITSAQFDVLISDLNFDHPADGFIVFSAMRRTQPNCMTLILTGYPGFDSALKALRNQVDDYLIKPADIPALGKPYWGETTAAQFGHVAATHSLDSAEKLLKSRNESLATVSLIETQLKQKCPKLHKVS